MTCNGKSHKFSEGNWCCGYMENKKADLTQPGTLGVVFQGGQKNWHDKPSIREQHNTLVAEAKALGHTDLIVNPQ